MKVTMEFPCPVTDQPHRLFLMPETEEDRSMLGYIRQHYKTTNFGIHPQTGEPLHVGIKLEPKE